jgi:hypothetical protein
MGDSAQQLVELFTPLFLDRFGGDRFRPRWIGLRRCDGSIRIGIRR